jgi:hypothetical protein
LLSSVSAAACLPQVVRVLAPDLLARLEEEQREGGRRAGTLTLKWRHAGAGWQRASASAPMPPAVASSGGGEAERADALVAAAMALLRRHLAEPFDLSLINLGATAFTEAAHAATGGSGTGTSRSIAAMLAGRAGQAGGQAPAGGELPAAAQPAAAPLHGTGGPPPDPRAAAEASAAQRRSYSGEPAQAPLLSKRAERQLRETGGHREAAAGQGAAGQDFLPSTQQQLPMQQQHSVQSQQSQGQQLSVQAAWPAQQPPTHQPRYQGQPQPRCCGGGYGFGAEGEEGEEDDASVWDDLQDLAAWRSDPKRPRRHSPVPLGNTPPSGEGPKLVGLASGSSGGSGDLAAVAGCGGGSSVPLGSRVILHADVDCFYCQASEICTAAPACLQSSALLPTSSIFRPPFLPSRPPRRTSSHASRIVLLCRPSPTALCRTNPQHSPHQRRGNICHSQHHQAR